MSLGGIRVVPAFEIIYILAEDPKTEGEGEGGLSADGIFFFFRDKSATATGSIRMMTVMLARLLHAMPCTPP